MADKKSTRFHERIKMKIPLQVYYNETIENKWTEQTETEELTICGAGFTLQHPLEPKRLVQLSLPMPKKFRVFAFSNEKYDVWAVVRYLQILPSNADGKILMMVGTAIIGANPPSSFLSDPTTRYDLKPTLADKSLWSPRELPRQKGKFVRSLEERYEIAAKIIIEKVDEQGRIIEQNEAETLNISESGAAILTKEISNAPKYVLVKKDNLKLLAAVRGFHKLDSGEFSRLHLEFISGKWAI